MALPLAFPAWLMLIATAAAQGQLPDVGLAPALLQAGPNGFARLTVGAPEARTVEQAYTVMIPVQEEVLRNGRPVVVTREVPETRTRTVEITALVPVNRDFAPGEYLVVNTAGQQIGDLRQLNGRTVEAIHLEVDDLNRPSVAEFYTRVLNRRTPIVLTQMGGGGGGPAPAPQPDYLPPAPDVLAP